MRIVEVKVHRFTEVQLIIELTTCNSHYIYVSWSDKAKTLAAFTCYVFYPLPFLF